MLIAGHYLYQWRLNVNWTLCEPFFAYNYIWWKQDKFISVKRVDAQYLTWVYLSMGKTMGCVGDVCEVSEGWGQMLKSFARVLIEPEGASQTSTKQPCNYFHYNTKLAISWHSHWNYCRISLAEPVSQLNRGHHVHGNPLRIITPFVMD